MAETPYHHIDICVVNSSILYNNITVPSTFWLRYLLSNGASRRRATHPWPSTENCSWRFRLLEAKRGTSVSSSAWVASQSLSHSRMSGPRRPSRRVTWVRSRALLLWTGTNLFSTYSLPIVRCPKHLQSLHYLNSSMANPSGAFRHFAWVLGAEKKVDESVGTHIL